MSKKLDVLVVGGGGREHAICHKLSQSALLGQLYCAPGNAGIAQVAQCVAIKPTDIDGVLDFVKKQKIDYVVVAPDDPLAAGMVDALQAAGVECFGPTAAAAQIEASKSFGKDVMQQAGIPTAACAVFDDMQQALEYVQTCPIPIVVKADGLALGKGVVVCTRRQQALDAVRDCMQGQAFGKSGLRVVIEECLQGPEMTVLAFSDGKTVRPMVSSQDHKRVNDQDQGPNTGGMGAVSPALHEQPQDEQWVLDHVLQPCVDELAARGCPFKGVLYAGLMRTPQGLKVIEFNARFGDPETQVVLPRLKNDLLEVFLACTRGSLDSLQLQWDPRAAVCVVAASGGYPGKYTTGLPIEGLNGRFAEDVMVYHAGTRLQDGQVVTAGGRVLGITAMGTTINEARARAYAAAGCIHFEGKHSRSDIAGRG